MLPNLSQARTEHSSNLNPVLSCHSSKPINPSVSNDQPARVSSSVLKKRSRISWTEAHIVKFYEPGIIRRRCFHYHACWLSAT